MDPAQLWHLLNNPTFNEGESMSQIHLTPDHSQANPGKMGWWEYDTDPIQKTLEKEQRAFDDLAAEYPARFTAEEEPEPINKVLIAKIKELMKANGMDDGFSFTMLEKLTFGDLLIWLAQLIGSCVASGFMRAVAGRTMAQTLILGDVQNVFGYDLTSQNNYAIFAPYSYRAGRSFAGINGNSDGSICGPHIKGAMEFGFLPCSAQGLDQYTDAYPEPQRESTYRTWGANDTLLNKFKSQAMVFDLLTSVTQKSGSDLQAMNARFETAMICSGWAFEPDYVHPQWKIFDKPVVIYKRNMRTSWPHNMTIYDVVFAFGRWWVYVKNSWGMNAHKNGDGFFISLELADTWLRSAQCQSIGSLKLRAPGEIVV